MRDKDVLVIIDGKESSRTVVDALDPSRIAVSYTHLIISAREKIVEGAVSMVRMALHKLSEEEIVELDEDKKAAMVSNLLVVLCADEAAQPVVNTGTLNH